MNVKIFAPAFAAALLVSPAAFAQQATGNQGGGGQNCAPGDANCPDTRSEMNAPGVDTGRSSMESQGTAPNRESDQSQPLNPGNAPTDTGSEGDGGSTSGGSGSGSGGSGGSSN